MLLRGGGQDWRRAAGKRCGLCPSLLPQCPGLVVSCVQLPVSDEGAKSENASSAEAERRPWAVWGMGDHTAMGTGSETSSVGSYGASARKGGAWFMGAGWLNFVIQIPASMVLARLLSPTEFGVAAVSTMVVQFGFRMTQFGLNTALVRVRSLEREHEGSVFVFNAVTGLAAFLACAAAAPWVGQFFGSADSGRLLPFAALVFLITPLGTVPNALLNRRLQFREMARVTIVNSIVAAGASIAMAWAGLGFWSLPAGTLVATCLSVVQQARLARWRPVLRFSRLAFAELVNYGGGVQAKRLIEYGRGNLDTVIVGRVLGITALGFYDKGFSTVNRFTQRVAIGASTTFRILAIISEDGERFRLAMQKIMMVAGLLVVPVLAAGVVARELFVVLYGHAWLPGVPAFQFLCVAGVFQVLSAYVGNASEALGRVWVQVAAQLLALVVFTLLVASGAHFGGTAGAAAGVSAAAFLEFALALAVIRSSSSLRWADLIAPLRVPVICASGLLLVLLAGRRFLSFAGVEGEVTLLSLELVTGGLYFAGFLIWCPDRQYRGVAAEFLEDLAPNLPRWGARWLAERFGL